MVCSRWGFLVAFLFSQFVGSRSSVCSDASWLCRSQAPFSSYFLNNYEHPRRVLKTKISLILFQHKLFVSLKSFHWFHIFYWFHIFHSVICSILLELPVAICARLSHASVYKEFIFLIGYTETNELSMEKHCVPHSLKYYCCSETNWPTWQKIHLKYGRVCCSRSERFNCFEWCF